jgi:pSer/pThr/pTyr-binding forkhead associated (FHA) protein/chromosome segregation ATPase
MSQHLSEVFGTNCGAAVPLELNVSGPGWADGERRVFENPFVLIGREERSCLRLEDAAVSRRHAYLQSLGGKVYCIDLGSRTGIRWGGELRSAGWLRPEQGVQIGPYTLELARIARGEEDSEERVAEDWDPLQHKVNDLRFLPRVTVEVDNKEVSRLHMNRVMVLVGSSPLCRIRLRGAGISRYHCSLVWTPQGVWLIDLLFGTGVRLNGQSIHGTLVNEGDRFEVGPYVLRVCYPDVCAEIPAETRMQSANDAPESRQRPSLDQGRLETLAAEVSVLAVSALPAQLDQARERQRDDEVQRRQLAESQAECDRLREQARALEVEVSGMTGLQARLEAAETRVRELDVVRGERDRWQAEAQGLQARLASEAAEREEWRQRLETAQQQLVEHCDAVLEAGVRLEQESAALQSVQADLAARNAEHDSALQQLQVIQEKLALAQDEKRDLQADLDQAHQRQRDVEALRQQLADALAEQARLSDRVPELENQASLADRRQTQLREVEAETERLREQLRVAESREAELEAVRAECDRLQEQARALKVEVSGMTGLQAQLEAAEAIARELDTFRDERDRWQTEAQELQVRLASEASEREEWRQRLEAAQQRLVEQRDAVANRDAEHDAALQRLQDFQEKLALAQDEKRGLQAALDQNLERQRDVEALRQQLADSQPECERLRGQAHALEVELAGMAGLQARLENAETRVRELDVVRGERDRWQAEVQELQARFASDAADQEQHDHLADLHAVQMERDQLQTELQMLRDSAEQERAKMADLERALTEAAATHETTCASWETERQGLEARLEQQAQSHRGAVETAIRDVQARTNAEREQWRMRLEGAESQLVWERGMFQEQIEQIRKQAAGLQAERDRLLAQLKQMESQVGATPERSADQARHAAELQHLQQQAAREQVFVQLSSMRMGGHLLQQAARSQRPDAPAEQPRPLAPLVGERSAVEAQPRLAAIAQEIQAGWGEPSVGQEQMPTIASQTVPMHEEEVPALPDTLDASAVSPEERPTAEDSSGCVPQEKDSPPEARQGLWRQILGFVVGK